MTDKYKFSNLSYSGADMVATMQIPNVIDDNGGLAVYTLGTLQTLTYSTHMARTPVRAIGNINAKDYVSGPRTIAGTLIFAVFNKHFAYEAMETITQKESSRFSFFADEMPPFDITVTFANEYGSTSRLALYGIRLVNEGQVMSVNDIYTENTYQFVARDMDYMTNVDGAASSNIKTDIITIRPSEEKNIEQEETSQELMYDVVNNSTSTINITDKVSNAKIVNLIVNTIDAKDGSINGVAKFDLDPPQSAGYIYVNGEGTKKEIELNVKNYLNNGESSSMYLNLPVGDYTAIYEDLLNSTYSQIKSFTINKSYNLNENQIPPPLVIGLSDTKMLLEANASDHNYIMYAKTDLNLNDSDFKEVSLSDNRALLTNLEANTNYTLYSKNNNNTSVILQVTTKKTSSEDYEKLKEYVSNNKNCLIENSKIEDYYRIIDETYKLTESDSGLIVFHDAFTKEKACLLSIYNALDKKSEDLEIEYINSVKADIDICNHLLIISQNLSNNEQYVINEKYNGLSTTPSQPKFLDAIKYTLLLSKNTERVEVYGIDDNGKKRDAVYSGSAFKRYNNDYFECALSVRPSTKYTVCSVNSYNIKSPKLEFYVPDDSARSAISKQVSSDTLTFNSLFSAAYNNVLNDIENSGLDSEDIKIITFQSIKTENIKTFCEPIINYVSCDSIKVKIDDSYLDINNIEDYYLVLAEANKMTSKEFFIKKKISKYGNTIVFTDKEDMVKENTTYALWIEGKDLLQVSPVSIVKTALEDTEGAVQCYNKKNMINTIRKTVSNCILINDELNNCIDALIGDSEVDSSNVYDKLIENVITYRPIIKDVEDIVIALFKLKIEKSSYINIDYFKDKMKVNINDMTITFPKSDSSYTIAKYNIPLYTKGEVTKTTIIVESGKECKLPIDSDYKLTAYFCINKDIYNKSGTVFVNTYTKKISSYKIRTEVL